MNMHKTIILSCCVVFILLLPISVLAQFPSDNDQSSTLDIGSVSRILYVDDDYTPSTPGWGQTRFDSIQAALAAVRENGIIYIYSGTYFEDNLNINKPITILGENPQTTILDGSTGAYGDTITLTVDNIRIRGLTIKNNDRYYSAIGVLSGHNTITNCVIENIGYGMLLEGYLADIRYNTIQENSFYSSGIWINGEDVSYFTTQTIQRNTVNRKPLYFYKSVQMVTVPSDAGQLIIADASHICITHLDISGIQRAVQIVFSDDIRISQCRIQGNGPTLTTGVGIMFVSSDDIKVTDSFLSDFCYGLWLQQTGHTYVKGNTFEQNDVGVYAYLTLNTNVQSNDFIGNEDGVVCSTVTSSFIQQNTFKENIQGITLIFRSTSNTIKGNTLDHNDVGIYLSADCNHNSISDNSLTQNNNGVHLNSFSDENSIMRNLFKENAVGMTLLGARFNRIFENDFQANSVSGIELRIEDVGWEHHLAYGNHIYHNNFFNNAQQAYDECINTWDCGYPCGGNYWSDYTGVDVNPQDGIGDTPYFIPGSEILLNQDNYPFMDPSGWIQ